MRISSDPNEELGGIPKGFEEYPGAGRWDNLPGDIAHEAIVIACRRDHPFVPPCFGSGTGLRAIQDATLDCGHDRDVVGFCSCGW